VRVVDIGAKDIDFEALLAEMGHQYLDFLYMPVKAMHVLKIERAVRALGLQSQMMMSDGVASNVILEFKEDIRLLNGLLAVDVFSTRRKKTPYGQIMKSSFTKSFQEPGTTIAALGCEGMSYLLTAMQKCDDPTNRVCINSKIHSQENFIGFSGVFHIREDGKAERPVFINRIDDGTLTNLVKIY
jgi:branched-chain amino acid transport system substrate-binding protein